MRNREHTMRGQRDYSQGKIYKIVDIESDACYVGSTVMPLCKRLSAHKLDKKCGTGASKHFREVGWDRARIVLVEEYLCDNVDQLRAREEHWRVKLKATMNQKRAHASLPVGAPRRDEDEKGYYTAYRAAHREERRAYDAAYHANHREEARTYGAAYRAQHREELRAYDAAYRAEHQEERRAYGTAYRAEHREKLLASKASYYAANRERLNQKARQKVTCPHCNTELTRGCLTRHIRRKHAT